MLIMLFTTIGEKAQYTAGFVEADVTEARRIIKESKSSGTYISFTAWLIKCLADAVKEYPEVNAYRKGRNAYVFESVNVGIMVDRELRGEMVSVPYLIKDCETKSVLDITREIKSVKEGVVGEDLVVADKMTGRIADLAARVPGPLARIALRIVFRDPVRKHKMLGTINVSSVGMYGKMGAWGLVFHNVHTLSLLVTDIARKPCYVGEGDEIQPRDILRYTLILDHNIIDGPPAARWGARFVELLESANGLEL
jgi:pyruvate/2-oxoglutarate dehydrogenase complex dihydrolipoamide acyltransferase (E2) component